MDKRGREEREEGLWLKAIARNSGSPMIHRGGLKKRPFPTLPRGSFKKGGKSIHFYHLFFTVSKKNQMRG
jgi:hypothetical protein